MISLFRNIKEGPIFDALARMLNQVEDLEDTQEIFELTDDGKVEVDEDGMIKERLHNNRLNEEFDVRHYNSCMCRRQELTCPIQC